MTASSYLEERPQGDAGAAGDDFGDVLLRDRVAQHPLAGAAHDCYVGWDVCMWCELIGSETRVER